MRSTSWAPSSSSCSSSAWLIARTVGSTGGAGAVMSRPTVGAATRLCARTIGSTAVRCGGTSTARSVASDNARIVRLFRLDGDLSERRDYAVNLASNLANCTQAQADRAVLRLGETTVTYRDLDQASARVTGFLRRFGIEPGDRVAIMLPNVSEFAITYYGVLRAGGVVVPMKPLLKSRGRGY